MNSHHDDVISLIPGHFKGSYFDVVGYRGDISLNIAVAGGEYHGDIELCLRDTDAPYILKGEIDQFSFAAPPITSESVMPAGTFRVRLTRAKKLDNKRKESGSAISTLFLRSASSFASQAIFGVMSPDSVNRLGGGIWIAWMFKRAEY
jgi:hypothetical protein